MLSLINGMLLERGKPSLGLINPAIYALGMRRACFNSFSVRISITMLLHSQFPDAARPNWFFNDVIVGTNYNGDLQLDPSSPYAQYCPYGYTTEIGMCLLNQCALLVHFFGFYSLLCFIFYSFRAFANEPGWDAVTGLGSPHFMRLAENFLNGPFSTQQNRFDL
jgi:hypothetical protein